MAPAETHEGSAGRYAIFGELASGGMATVHVGRLLGPHGFARTVAIKRLHPQFAKDPDFVAMFMDEAHLAARIRHPNVVPTLDVVAGDDQLLLVMEYVVGESLSRLLRAAKASGGRMPPSIVSAIAVGMLHGLHAAHEAKNEFGEPLDIVHRDVSPQNVLVGTDGVARVLDFGVAKAIGRLSQTRGPELKGKVPYMSPEQIRGIPVNRKTDIFAASVVLWEALTMERLFATDNDAATMQRVLTKRVPAPSTLAPELPPDVDLLVLRGLEREPSKRWATAREMALALEQALPPALPSEVGEWVERTAGEALEKRAQRVAEIESSSAVNRPAEIISSSEFIADVLWPGLDGRGTDAPSAQGTRSGDEADPSELGTEPYRPPPSRKRPAAIDEPARPARAPPSAASGSRPPPAQPTSEPILELDLPPAPVAVVQQPTRSDRARRVVRAVGMVAIVALALFGVASLLLPRYVRGRVVEAAEEQGLTMSINDVTVGLHDIRLRGIVATCADLPGLRASATEIRIETALLEAKVFTVRGAEVTIDGAWADVLAAAERFHANRGTGTEAAPTAASGAPRVLMPLVHLTWTRIFGGDSRLEVPDGIVDLTPHAPGRLGDEYHFTTQRLALTTTAGALGPWRLDLDRDVHGSRLRLAFDPPVPDGPNLLLVQGAAGEANLDANIPRSPLFRLGLSSAIASLVPGAPQQVEGQLHYARMPGRTEASSTFTLAGAKVPQAPGPMDITVSGSLSGDGRGPLELKDGVLTAGPFKATLTGPITIDDAVRASLIWKALPVPCAQLAPPGVKQATNELAKQLGQLGDLGDVKQQLADLGLDVGTLDVAHAPPRVSGTLTAAGTLMIDTSDLGKCTFTVKPKNTCGLSLFAGR